MSESKTWASENQQNRNKIKCNLSLKMIPRNTGSQTRIHMRALCAG